MLTPTMYAIGDACEKARADGYQFGLFPPDVRRDYLNAALQQGLLPSSMAYDMLWLGAEIRGLPMMTHVDAPAGKVCFYGDGKPRRVFDIATGVIEGEEK